MVAKASKKALQKKHAVQSNKEADKGVLKKKGNRVAGVGPAKKNLPPLDVLEPSDENEDEVSMEQEDSDEEVPGFEDVEGKESAEEDSGAELVDASNETSDDEEDAEEDEVAEEEADAEEDEAAEEEEATEEPEDAPAVNTKPEKTECKPAEKRSFEERKKEIEDAANRTVFIKNVPVKTNEEGLREHFAECGIIEKVVLKPARQYAFVEFKEVSARDAALKMHNSILNNVTINVFPRTVEKQSKAEKDPKRTVVLENTKQLTSVQAATLTKIFAKCGEIEVLDILCKKNVLAFMVFKSEQGVANAMKLNGKTIDNIELQLSEYQLPVESENTSVFVKNVKPGTTVEEIEKLFEQAGALENVFLRNGFAIVKFKDTDGFCKSFLLNEAEIQGQMIFLEPHSERKSRTMLNSQKKNGSGPKRHLTQQDNNQKRFKPNTN